MLLKSSFWVLSLILVATSCSVVDCSPCICGGGSTDISTLSLFDLLSCLFDQEYQETALLKYDRVNDEWVTDCPVVENCLYGVDEGGMLIKGKIMFLTFIHVLYGTSFESRL